MGIWKIWGRKSGVHEILQGADGKGVNPRDGEQMEMWNVMDLSNRSLGIDLCLVGSLQVQLQPSEKGGNILEGGVEADVPDHDAVLP